MDQHNNHESFSCYLNSSVVDELNMSNPPISQSSQASSYNIEATQPHLSNLFISKSNQVMTQPNHFSMCYGFQSTFNPHFQQTYPFQGLFNHQIFPSETPARNKSKRHKKSQNIPQNISENILKNIQNKDFEPPQPIRRNWTKEEDVALTKAWLHISIDPIIGTDQSSDTLWKCIHPIWKQYLGKDFMEDRPIHGLSKRWCTIQAAVNKFHGIYEHLGRSPRSGTNLDDLKKDAHRVYKEMSAENKPFLFEHCWDECKNNAKWCLQIISSNLKKTNDNSPSPPSNASSSPTSNDHVKVGTTKKSSLGVNETLRPPGRKISKENKNMQSQDRSMVDVLIKMQESMQQQYSCSKEELELKRESTLMMKKEYELKEDALKKDVELKEKELALQEKELEMQKDAQRRRNQQNILNQDLSNLAPAARAIIEKMQERIVKEWNEEDRGYL